MSDYEKHHAVLSKPGATQVIVIKRYDDNGGMYTGTVATWPKTEDEMGWETTYRLDFLDDHNQFGTDLVANGYICMSWEFMPEGFRNFVTYNILPIEWHGAMDELGSRVQVYINTNMEDK